MIDIYHCLICGSKTLKAGYTSEHHRSCSKNHFNLNDTWYCVSLSSNSSIVYRTMFQFPWKEINKDVIRIIQFYQDPIQVMITDRYENIKSKLPIFIKEEYYKDIETLKEKISMYLLFS